MTYPCSLCCIQFVSVVNLLIEKLYDKKTFNQQAILMSIRPLMIGTKTRINNFKQYKPPGG